MNKIDRAILAYTAGAVDGEGSIFISKSKPHGGEINYRYILGVSISNSDIRMLQYIQRYFGGRIIEAKRARKDNLIVYRLDFTNKQAAKFLRKIYGYLVIKKEEADVAFKIRETFENFYGSKSIPKDILEERENCYEKLKWLHRNKEHGTCISLNMEAVK